jgi:hypothetical protein
LFVLKLASLLAQYLYLNKRLDLPGLGSFILNPVAMPEGETSKPGKLNQLEGVYFESNPSIKEVPELVQFISSQTGKIKALATSDLESFLEVARQFLNIGKPFSIEGIGTLEKLSTGEFSFSAGQGLPTSLKEQHVKDSSASAISEEPIPDYKSVFYTRKGKPKWKKPFAFFLLMAGLALAIWGGYIVYKRTTAKNKVVTAAEKKEVPVPEVPVPKQQDSVITIKDTVTKTVQVTPPPPPLPSGNFKFIIETAGRERALPRFTRLKKFGLDVKMETKDSSLFKIFFILPATTADTARMLDSLRGIYTPAGNRAYVEN